MRRRYDKSRDEIIVIDNVPSSREEGRTRIVMTKGMLNHRRAIRDVEGYIMKNYNIKVDWRTKEG